MYFPKWKNLFVQIAKCICQEAAVMNWIYNDKHCPFNFFLFNMSACPLKPKMEQIKSHSILNSYLRSLNTIQQELCPKWWMLESFCLSQCSFIIFSLTKSHYRSILWKQNENDLNTACTACCVNKHWCILWCINPFRKLPNYCLTGSTRADFWFGLLKF